MSEAGAKVAPVEYRNPATGEIWDGHGMRPKWLRALLRDGQALGNFAVAPRKAGDLQVWWVPQVPMKAFTVDVASVEEAAKLLEVLAMYDLFQLEHRIKPDFANAGGLNRWVEDSDGEGRPGWESWYDEATGSDLDEWLASKKDA